MTNNLHIKGKKILKETLICFFLNTKITLIIVK